MSGDPTARMADLQRALDEMAEATDRLLAGLDRLTERDVRGPSLLPGWTRAHVLTHLARNADGLAVLAHNARTGEDRPMYPDDLTDSRAHLAGFLAQYWGGGMEQYSAERGHPRLRMRHVHFAIGQDQRDAWYRHMADAVLAAELPAELEAQMLGYFATAADHLVNAPG